VPLMMGESEPTLIFSFEALEKMKKEGLERVQGGAFEAALSTFQRILHCLLLTAASSDDESTEMMGLLKTAAAYTLVLNMQIAKKGTTDPVRSLELVNLMTCVNIEVAHQFLFLRQAMAATYKAENYLDAAGFATRILSQKVGTVQAGSYVEKTIQQARGVFQASEERGGTNKIPLSFDVARVDPATARVCAGSLTVIADGEPADACSYCGALYKRHFLKKACSVCKLGEVGRQVMGVEFRKKF